MLGRFGSVSFLAFAVLRPMGFGVIELVDGATRYARPWRPVKPLDMIWEDNARSEAHLAQRRCEACPSRKLSVSGGLVLVALSMELVRATEAVLSVLDFRRRKDSDGTKYVGNSVGGDEIDGNGGIMGTCHDTQLQ